MKVFTFVTSICVTLIGYSQPNSPIFEKYIEVIDGSISYACNFPLLLLSVNDVRLNIEPIAYQVNSRMAVVGFAVFMPEDVVWSKRKPTLFIQFQNKATIELAVFIFERIDGICYFKLTPQNKRHLELNPISRIILKNNKQKYTSKELSANQSVYFIELIDQETHQIYSPIDWSYPYYYTD